VTALLFVIAHSSSATYKGQAIDLRQVGQTGVHRGRMPRYSRPITATEA
jgi:hypothetical protein